MDSTDDGRSIDGGTGDGGTGGGGVGRSADASAPAAPAAGLATCAQTGPITPGTLARLACDAILQTALLAPGGAVLNLGRTVRTATLAQRRALTARDRGCIIPGCTTPPTGCDAHHLTYWRHGGSTDIDNLALLCPAHHTAVHTRTWTIHVHDHLPWVRPPTWLDPHQPLTRNTTHHATQAAHHLGQQLHLNLEPGRDGPDVAPDAVTGVGRGTRPEAGSDLGPDVGPHARPKAGPDARPDARPEAGQDRDRRRTTRPEPPDWPP